MRKLTLKELAQFLGLQTSCDETVTMWAIDSRRMQKGGVFFALKGQRVDGCDFADEVKAAGALAIVASKSIEIEGIEVFVVPDVLQQLQKLAQWVYAQKRCKVIGVTGSIGKTTTKECIAQGLKGSVKVGFSPDSYNSQRTLPIAILNCPDDVDVCVLEYAMSEKGQLKRLVEIAPPEIGVMTPIDYVHAENFDSLEEIGKEKAELFRSPHMMQGFVHEKSWEFVKDVGNFPKEVYGENKEGPFALAALNENYQAAVKVGRFLGVQKLGEIQPVAKRFEVIRDRGVVYVNDSYNANLTTFIAAMENLPQGKRKIGVLGSMGELGKFSRDCHQQVATKAEALFDELLYFGEEWQGCIRESATIYASFDKLKTAFLDRIQPGDVVLVKGSNRHQLWRLLERT